MIYYGLPQFGIELDPIPSAMIGLSPRHLPPMPPVLRRHSSGDKVVRKQLP